MMEKPYFSINIILVSTLSIANLIEIWKDYSWNEYENSRYRTNGALWPLGAGLWPVPVTAGLLVAMIHCQRVQRLDRDVSKTIAVIKALVSSNEPKFSAFRTV